jgi:hypothetical protein
LTVSDTSQFPEAPSASYSGRGFFGAVMNFMLVQAEWDPETQRAYEGGCVMPDLSVEVRGHDKRRVNDKAHAVRRANNSPLRERQVDESVLR